MAINITLPKTLESQLQDQANASKLSLQEMVIEILTRALAAEDDYPTPEQVVAEIQATPKNPNSFRPASGSLADALRNAPEDPDFDLDTWNREWAAVEQEMKTTALANAIAEGRG
mgnify:CR=1 FL=1